MKSLMKTLSLLLAICLMLSLAACVPISTNSTNPCTEKTTLPTESSQPTESSPAIPEDTTSSTEGTVVTEPTISPTAPSEEATTPAEEATSPTGSSETEPTEIPVQYPLSYADETATITITREWFENAWCYIAHLQFTDYTRFGTACANGVYDNGFETTSHAAQRLGAIFTVNGCCSAPFLDYPVIRSGVLCNGSGRNLWVPAVYSSTTGLLQSAWETGGTDGIAGVTIDELVETGAATDTFSFGPPILTNGSVVSNSDDSRAQRNFIGTNGNPGDIWIVISEGRYLDGESAGLTYSQCARLLAEKGCTFGVPLDGGGSCTMVFQGEVLNSAKGRERSLVDFVYFK